MECRGIPFIISRNGLDSSDKRIAKNTLFLYLRMLVFIAVNLYTVRVLWRILGVDDYGIFNVVGGIVLMFAFLNNAMIQSSQRYISYGLGRGDMDALRKTFSISVSVHFLLAIAVAALAETVGLWFLNSELNIPSDRMAAANWVYQCSLGSLIVKIVSVPYNSCVVAHEHMKAYGYFGILEVILQLVIVLLLPLIPFDRLVTYSVLLLAVTALMRIIYGVYCSRYFEECRFTRHSDKGLMKEMFSFAGWSFLGNMGFSVRDQGLNILINMFFNVAVNAAKGISNQIGAVVNGFATNFTMAVNPQITKRYAAGDTASMMKLVFNGCRYSFLLMCVVVMPLLICADSILGLWLGEVAPYTVGFLQLSLVVCLIDSIISPLVTALQATGRIRRFQIVISLIMLANIPMAWIWLRLQADPYVVMYVTILTSVVGLWARLRLLRRLIPFSIGAFLRRVYARPLPCVLIMEAILWVIYPVFPSGLWGLILFVAASMLIILPVFYFVILSSDERRQALDLILHRRK